MEGMQNTANVFYSENNLQDLDVVGQKFTDEDLENIKNLEHVKNAERKLTITGTMESEEDKTLQINFIESNEISKFYVADGKAFNKETKGVWLDEYYANHNNLKVGDTIKIKYDKMTLEEEIIGLVNIPDHVYDIKDESAIFPNHIGYGFWIATFATIVGLIVGPLFIGNLFIGMEMSYFQVPNGQATVSNSGFLVAIAVVLIVSLVTYITCRSELKESPAETLRTEMPNIKKNSLNITTKGIFKNMGFSSKWNIRDIIRNKMRTLMGIAGMAGCCMLLVGAFGMLDTMKNFIDTQFEKLYNFDYKLTLKSEYTEDVLDKITAEYGNNTRQTSIRRRYE